MNKVFSLVIIILLSAVAAAAQTTEAVLKQYFEGRQVVLKIDMPATSDGISIYPERAQPLNYDEYATRLKRQGTAIRSGESMIITRIKVEGKHIEFQLGDSERARIEQKERRGVSTRFNIHFKAGTDRQELTPEGLIEALRKYVDFSNVEAGTEASYFRRTSYQGEKKVVVDRRVIRLGPPTTYLKEGLTAREVVMLLGQPVSVSERQEGDLKIITYAFPRSAGRVLVAEFANELLISSRTEIRGSLVHAEIPGN